MECWSIGHSGSPTLRHTSMCFHAPVDFPLHLSIAPSLRYSDSPTRRHSILNLAPEVGIAPTSQLFQSRANLPQLLGEEIDREVFGRTPLELANLGMSRVPWCG